MALCERDENVQSTQLKQTQSTCHDSTISDHRYPDWLLEHRKRKCFVLEDFAVHKDLLGRGKFGTAQRAKVKATGHIVVLKSLEKDAILAENVHKQFQREVEVHCRLSHPNICRMYAYFHDDRNCYLVLEMAGGGSLYGKQQAMPAKRFQERTAAIYIRQLCSALAYCHGKGVLHRDIKPENILLAIDKHTGREVLKLADFGWCATQRSNSARTTFCGTPEYLPPELCLNALHVPGATGEYGSPFDMYDVGVLLYEMLLGHAPFQWKPQNEAAPGEYTALMQEIAAGGPKFPAVHPRISVEAQELIRSLMSFAPEERPTAPDVLAHPWVLQYAGVTAAEEWGGGPTGLMSA